MNAIPIKGKKMKLRAVFLAGLLVVGLAHADDESPAEPAGIQDILNFHQMTDDIAIGGQPTAGQLSHIADEGYSVVVNLATHESNSAIPEEGRIIASMGLSYVHIPVPIEAPTPNHVRKFFKVMDSLDGEKVFVHCASSGRVSAFMHRYMMLKKGASPEEATSPLLQRWMPRMDETWKSILKLELAEIEE